MGFENKITASDWSGQPTIYYADFRYAAFSPYSQPYKVCYIAILLGYFK